MLYRTIHFIGLILLTLFVIAGCSGEEDNITTTSQDPDADGAAMCGITIHEDPRTLSQLNATCTGKVGCVDVGEYHIPCGQGDRYHCSYCYNEQCIRAFFQSECYPGWNRDTWQNPQTDTDVDAESDTDALPLCGIVYDNQHGELASLHTQCAGKVGCFDFGEYYNIPCGQGDRYHCSYCSDEQCIRAFFQSECSPGWNRDVNEEISPDFGSPTPANTEHFNVAPTDLLTASYGDWQVLYPERASRIDVGLTQENWLVVEPTVLEQNAWFQDAYGPLVYRSVTGDFAVVTHLRVVSRDNPDQPPGKDFSAGGFVIRDPAGTHNGDENWVMYNMGAQGPPGVNYGREIKKTLNSNSDLFINPQQDIDAYLKVCRLGSRFYFFHWSSIDQTWREEQFFNNVQIDGALATTFTPAGTEITPELGPIPDPGTASPLSFDHPALPATLQVGVMGHVWSGALDTRAEFDFVSFSADAPASYSDCVSMFPNPTQF